MLTPEDIILVPRGAEHSSIRRGLRTIGDLAPQIIPINLGAPEFLDSSPVSGQSLEFLNKFTGKIVLMGLGGSLSDRYRVGDEVICQGCGTEKGDYWQCEPEITAKIAQLTGYSLVKGLTCDRLISQSEEKRRLGQGGYEVVDMEGSRILAALPGQKVAIVRVISDEVTQDLPDLAPAIDNQGQLLPLPLARQMLIRPVAAFRLIQGSLKGLSVLTQVVRKLCGSNF
ncbi:MAG: hypothetical protein GPJ13_07225 [Microcystis aeruginosa W11-06]|nr:hypothetical protein [Microcystis aeruginosa W11-03]NCR93563.1 hypothetical protein [Microcystis aeruginosa W11-06]